MKKILFLSITIIICNCATLTDTQINAVNNFATTTSSYSNYPSKITKELNNIRLKRGITYVTTIKNRIDRKKKLDSIYSSLKTGNLLTQNVDLSLKIIDKYAQSLALLSSDKITSNLKEQASKFGIGIDSLVTLYNKVENKNLPSNIGEALGKIITTIGKQYVKYKQAKEIKKFVKKADIIIDTMTDNLIDFLDSESIHDIIKTEERLLNIDYSAYLNLNSKVDKNNLEEYLTLKNNLEMTKKLRDQVSKSTCNLRLAHKKLCKIIKEKQNLKFAIKEFQSLYTELKEIKNTISQIKK